jgi:hypothetical protein
MYISCTLFTSRKKTKVPFKNRFSWKFQFQFYFSFRDCSEVQRGGREWDVQNNCCLRPQLSQHFLTFQFRVVNIQYSLNDVFISLDKDPDVKLIQSKTKHLLFLFTICPIICSSKSHFFPTTLDYLLSEGEMIWMTSGLFIKTLNFTG